MEEIVYFELNNWFCGRDYPEDEPFIRWLENDCNQQFMDKDWVKENKLCVLANIGHVHKLSYYSQEIMGTGKLSETSDQA